MSRKDQERMQFRPDAPPPHPHHMNQYPYKQPDPPDSRYPPDPRYPHYPERFDHPPPGYQPQVFHSPPHYPPPQYQHGMYNDRHYPIHPMNQQPPVAVHPPPMAPGVGHPPEKNDKLLTLSRLAIFIVNPKQNYQLLEDDLRELFSYYCENVQNITIWHDRAAAEVVLSSLSSCTSACRDLDGLFLQGVGTLKCIVLNPGQNIESTLPPPDNIHMRQGPELKKICRLELIDIFTYEPDFNVANNILGQNNCNIEYIMSQTGNKVEFSLRGKPLDNAPVSDRLHVSLTSNDSLSYKKAVDLTEGLLITVVEKFYAFCSSIAKPASPSAGFRRHEYQERPDGSLEYLGAREMERPPQVWRK